MKLPVYLDYHATTPCDPRVVEAMLPYFSVEFGNAASRQHAYGWKAEEAVRQAREKVASMVNCSPEEIVFTSGATESDNLALKGVFELMRAKGNHIITCETEHKAVLDACHHLEQAGAEITRLPVGPDGNIDLSQLEQAIGPKTILIALMYANNETGILHPIRQIGELARKHQVYFFTDATQAGGKLAINLETEPIDLLALSAHKMYGPKGVGALFARRKKPRVRPIAQMDGGGHEKGMRSGTLNVPGIVGFGKACEIAIKESAGLNAAIAGLRNRLEMSLLQLGEVYVNGNSLSRLPTVANLAFRYVDGQALLTALNKKIAVSSGSACSSASAEPSHVLKAMGLGDEVARSSIRFSLGRFTTQEEIDYTIETVREAVEAQRKESPLWHLFRKGETQNQEDWHHPALRQVS